MRRKRSRVCDRVVIDLIKITDTSLLTDPKSIVFIVIGFKSITQIKYKRVQIL